MRNPYDDDEIPLHYPTIEEIYDLRSVLLADETRRKADLSLNHQKPPGSWTRPARTRPARKRTAP